MGSKHVDIGLKFTRGIAEGPGGVVVSTAGGLRLHPVKVVIQPGGRRVGNGCAEKHEKKRLKDHWLDYTDFFSVDFVL